MVSAGMPELMDREDVYYLRDMLCLDATDKQAEKRFKAEIKNSLDGTWRRIDNWIHNAKVRKQHKDGTNLSMRHISEGRFGRQRRLCRHVLLLTGGFSSRLLFV
jgi:hypothetical protein